jgi:hypothetical protein
MPADGIQPVEEIHIGAKPIKFVQRKAGGRGSCRLNFSTIY